MDEREAPTEEKAEREQATGSAGSHAMAIGYYIASIVLIFGSILVLYGLLGPPSQSDNSLGFNLNLWWGLVMIAFGAGAFVLSYLSRRRHEAG